MNTDPDTLAALAEEQAAIMRVVAWRRYLKTGCLLGGAVPPVPSEADYAVERLRGSVSR